ncbi:MAG TPA: hypothetical protein VFM65_08205 [Flavobacteriaceae bacterium]|nr:hypothetical protein [Flavobacteriaceae bacterium]
MKKNLNNCYHLELKNINQYYSLVYQNGLSHETVDILLEQKGKLEECLLVEVEK